MFREDDKKKQIFYYDAVRQTFFSVNNKVCLLM